MTIEEKYAEQIANICDCGSDKSDIVQVLYDYFNEVLERTPRYNLEVHRYNSEITRAELHRYPEGLWVKYDELIA